MADYGDYGDGTIYNDGTLYGLPPASPPPPDGGSDNEGEASFAASKYIRQTGLQVIVQGWGLNNWELLAGSEIVSPKDATDSTLQTYWSYRDAADVCQLDNGTIVRVRLGADRSVEKQEITDGTSVSQWTTWTSAYGGPAYGVAVISNGASYSIYYTTADGLYKDGSQIFAKDGLINPIPVVGDGSAVFVMRVSQDMLDTVNPLTGATWKKRRMDLWYAPDGGTFAEDAVNYRWYRNGIAARLMDDGSVVRIQTNGMYTNPRAYETGDSITYATMDSVSDLIPSPPLLIRGLGAQVGHNTVAGGRIFKLSDDFYYLIYDEYHSDVDFESIVTPGINVCWQRSRDLKHWSEPVFTGFQAAIGGLVEDANWVYYCGNGAVWRRPKGFTSHDISNYVPECSMNLPRDNQDASAEVRVANPNGVNDALFPLSGNVVQIRPGIRIADGSYAYKDFNRWYLKKTTRDTNGNVNRLNLRCTDLWGRLDNPLRDTFNWVGQFTWDDWGAGLRNKIFNYFFDIRSTKNFTPTTSQDTNTMNCKGTVLYTGWKGHNVIAHATLDSTIGDQFNYYYRYVDSKNYYRLKLEGSTGTLIRSKTFTNDPNEVATETTLATGTFVGQIGIDIRWARHKILAAGSVVIDYTEPDPGSKPGYVGWKVGKISSALSNPDWTLTNFHLEDYETPLTTGDLIKTALAMGDYHDALVADTDAPQYAIIWGPQTDVPTPAVALKTLLDGEKLQLIWSDGAYHVAKFVQTTIKRTLEDEVIESSQTDEANRRINLALVDGNSDTWIEVDAEDTQRRGWQINAYYDAPELLTPEAVKARAIEEIRRGSEGDSPGGRTPLQFDLDRMDCITWVDNAGNSSNCRIQGMNIEINQSTDPSQRCTWDLALLDFVQP